MSKEHELLLRAVEMLRMWQEEHEYKSVKDFIEEISDFLSTPEPDPVCLFAGWLTCQPGIMEVGACCDASPMAQAIDQYFQEHPERMFETKLHPAPRPEFVRLSEEEIVSWWGVATEAGLIEFARAIEDALEEKNSG